MNNMLLVLASICRYWRLRHWKVKVLVIWNSRSNVYFLHTCIRFLVERYIVCEYDLEIVSNRNFMTNIKTKQEGNADPALKPDLFIFLSTMQTLPNQIPWDQLKWSVYWAFRLSEVFILVEYVHVRNKKSFCS